MSKPDYDEKFLRGIENRAIRYYYYLNNGLNIVNQFRNLLLGIFALYFTLKLENWILMPIIFIVSAAGLTVVGYYCTFRMNRVMEYLTTRFSSHYGIKSFDLQQEILKNLQEINAKLK